MNSDVLAAYHAVVEGSGMVMMFRWLLAHPQALSPEDLAAAMPSSESLNRAPAAIWKPLLFAYLQGQSFLEAGRRTLRKQDRKTDPNIHLDQAFLSPPRSTEQILHPHKYWDPEQLDEPRAVSHDRSRLPEEWKLSLSDTLGELMLALVVEEPSAIDLGDPLAMMALRFTHPAAQGWDGDEVLLLERADGAWLMVHAVVLDGPEDAGELQAALEAARERIEEGLRDLAGEEQASGLAIWLEGSHLVRWLTCTGLELEPALKLARSLPVTVGPDPLTSPHEDPLAR